MPLGIFGSNKDGPKPQPLPSIEKGKKMKKEKGVSSSSHSGNDVKGSTIKMGKKSYTIEKKIAEGGFAIVYLVSDKRGRNYALKRQLIRDDPRQLEACKTEIQIVKNLNGHKNIVAYIDHQLTVNKAGVYEYMLLTVYYPTNVLQMMNSRVLVSRWLTTTEILDIFCDVCEAVARLHHSKTPVLHRDLKIENVLIDKRSGSEKPVYTLCDYGSATTKVLSLEQYSQNFIEDEIQRYTTIGYRAPEMINLFSGLPIDTKSDIWALGIMLYKLCYFALPFGESALSIQNGIFTFPSVPSDISNEVKAIINLCLTQSSKHRPNIYQISYLAFTAMGRKCPVYNIEKSSRIEISEAVQILHLRDKLGPNYARAFERALDEFEDQRQAREAKGRAQLITAKILGSPLAQNAHDDGALNEEKTTTLEQKSSIGTKAIYPNSSASHYESEEQQNGSTVGEEVIVSTVSDGQQRLYVTTSVNPRLRPKPSQTNANFRSMSSSYPTPHTLAASKQREQIFLSPRLATLDSTIPTNNSITLQEILTRSETNREFAMYQAPNTSSLDVPDKFSQAIPHSPSAFKSNEDNEMHFKDENSESTLNEPKHIDTITLQHNRNSIEEPRSSAFRPYTIAGTKKQELASGCANEKFNAEKSQNKQCCSLLPSTSFNPFIPASDDDGGFGKCFDELARRRHIRGQSAQDIGLTNDIPVTTCEACTLNILPSESVEGNNKLFASSRPLTARLAKRLHEISIAERRIAATTDEFWRCVPSSYKLQLTGCNMSEEEFVRAFEEDPFGSAPNT